MKQIKTIKNRLDNNEDFDVAVNKALADGWILVKREVLVPNTPDRFTMLYVELEKEVVTEAERCCENCLHFENASTLEPCASCSEDCNKWEAWR
jgi:hypothetical protein